MDATPTPTSTPSPTPTPTPTYPDAQTLINDAAQVYFAIQTAHFEVKRVAEQPGIVKVTIDGTGDATCKGPSLKMTVKASNELEGTSQVSSTKVSYIQIKNKTWRKGSKKTAKWKVAKNAANVSFYQVPYGIGNPLACTSPGGAGSGSGSGAPTDVFKDATTVGPDTYQGVPVWHVTETDVRTLSDGSTIDIPYDLLIGQAHFIPYAQIDTINDTADNIVLTDSFYLNKIGEKVKVSAPKTG